MPSNNIKNRAGFTECPEFHFLLGRNIICGGPTCYPPLTGVSRPAPAELTVVRTAVSEVSAGPVTVAGLAHLMLDHALARPGVTIVGFI